MYFCMLGLYNVVLCFLLINATKYLQRLRFVFCFVFVSYEGKSVYLINVAGCKSLSLYVGCVVVYVG